MTTQVICQQAEKCFWDVMCQHGKSHDWQTWCTTGFECRDAPDGSGRVGPCETVTATAKEED